MVFLDLGNKIDKNWWQSAFDQLYLQTDARSVCNADITAREVDFIESVLNANLDDALLDLCGGQGRHGIELSQRGYQDVTVLDFSEFLISYGRRQAKEKNLSTIFIQGDARTTGLPDYKFKHLIIMGNSFGYFTHDDENLKILQEAFRILSAGGILLIDLPWREFVSKNSKTATMHRTDNDLTVKRTRRMVDNIIYTREIVISDQDGCLRDHHYCIRLYSEQEICLLLSKAGFSNPAVLTNFMPCNNGQDYGFMTNRMIVQAKKV